MANLLSSVIKKPAAGYKSILSRGLQTSEIPVKEVTIPAPWGHIAGKLWGDDQKQPVIAIHGWQENCGAWDALMPLLCDQLSILALDTPGHGQSSWFPPGMVYETWDSVRYIMNVKEYYKWDKLSIIAHSIGSIGALKYASLFPEDVDFFIAFEHLVFEDLGLPYAIERIPYLLKKVTACTPRIDSNTPAFTKKEIFDKWYQGTYNSISKDKLHHIVDRGIVSSAKHPGRYHLSRDPRVKFTLPKPEDKEYVEMMMARLKQPLLNIQGSESYYRLDDEFCMKIKEILKTNNPNFENHVIKGTHHIHLNNPEEVAPIILNFLRKHNFIQ